VTTHVRVGGSANVVRRLLSADKGDRTESDGVVVPLAVSTRSTRVRGAVTDPHPAAASG